MLTNFNKKQKLFTGMNSKRGVRILQLKNHEQSEHANVTPNIKSEFID
jgi:hypothetical protein